MSKTTITIIFLSLCSASAFFAIDSRAISKSNLKKYKQEISRKNLTNKVLKNKIFRVFKYYAVNDDTANAKRYLILHLKRQQRLRKEKLPPDIEFSDRTLEGNFRDLPGRNIKYIASVLRNYKNLSTFKKEFKFLLDHITLFTIVQSKSGKLYFVYWDYRMGPRGYPTLAYMKNSNVFYDSYKNYPTSYKPKRIVERDIDSDGTPEIVFVHEYFKKKWNKKRTKLLSSKIALYFNIFKIKGNKIIPFRLNARTY